MYRIGTKHLYGVSFCIPVYRSGTVHTFHLEQNIDMVWDFVYQLTGHIFHLVWSYALVCNKKALKTLDIGIKFTTNCLQFQSWQMRVRPNTVTRKISSSCLYLICFNSYSVKFQQQNAFNHG